MSKTLKTALWLKYIAVIALFLVSVSINFWIFRSDPALGFDLLLWWKPPLVLAFSLGLNLLFHFPGKVSVPNIIPSTFLILSVLIFVDLGFLVWKYFAILSPHTSFWVVYAFLTAAGVWNLQKYVRAFTVGV